MLSVLFCVLFEDLLVLVVFGSAAGCSGAISNPTGLISALMYS